MSSRDQDLFVQKLLDAMLSSWLKAARCEYRIFDIPIYKAGSTFEIRLNHKKQHIWL